MGKRKTNKNTNTNIDAVIRAMCSAFDFDIPTYAELVTSSGYKLISSYWMDFSIADDFGADAVQKHFDMVLPFAKTDCVYLAELTIVMGWKSCQHYRKGNEKLFRLYQKFYNKTREWACANLKGDDFKTYCRIIV